MHPIFKNPGGQVPPPVKSFQLSTEFVNVLAQELHAHGYKLYYYNSKKKGELDFVMEHDGQALPIEVKRQLLRVEIREAMKRECRLLHSWNL